MEDRKRRQSGWALLIASTLIASVIGDAPFARAATPCDIPELTWAYTDANNPLVAPGTKISFSSRCVGASEAPFKVQVADGSGSKLFLLDGVTTGSGDLASTTDIFIPVRGAEVCVAVGGTEVCKRFSLDSGSDTNSPPRAAFDTSCDALTCSFTDHSSDPGGSIQSRAWDLDGDGTVDSTEKDPSHTYPLAGTYDVRLTVTDDRGTTTSTTQSVTVSSPPLASFDTACDDLVCTFSDTSSDLDGEITAWEWDLDGNGSSDSHDPSLTHSYATAGTYEVVLTVTDDGGATDSARRSVTVFSPLAIETLELPPAKKKVAYSTNLTAVGGKPAYVWSLVSGALPAGLGLSPDGTISGKPKNPGSYSIDVKVTDQQQPTKAATRTFTIVVSPH